MHGGNLNGTGNALNNMILGTDGDNVLKGMDGNDTLIGGKGIDSLIGGAGSRHLRLHLAPRCTCHHRHA